MLNFIFFSFWFAAFLAGSGMLRAKSFMSAACGSLSDSYGLLAGGQVKAIARTLWASGTRLRTSLAVGPNQSQDAGPKCLREVRPRRDDLADFETSAGIFV
jgi:hypothetical protein